VVPYCRDVVRGLFSFPSSPPFRLHSQFIATAVPGPRTEHEMPNGNEKGLQLDLLAHELDAHKALAERRALIIQCNIFNISVH
jgi:hypothetical protein